MVRLIATAQVTGCQVSVVVRGRVVNTVPSAGLTRTGDGRLSKRKPDHALGVPGVPLAATAVTRQRFSLKSPARLQVNVKLVVLTVPPANATQSAPHRHCTS